MKRISSVIIVFLISFSILSFADTLKDDIPSQLPGNIYFYAGVLDFEEHYDNLMKSAFWKEFSKTDVKKNMEQSRKGLRLNQELDKYEDILGFTFVRDNFKKLLGNEVAIALYEFKDLHSVYVIKVDKQNKVKRFLQENKSKLKENKYKEIVFYGFDSGDSDNTFGVLFTDEYVFIANQIELIRDIIDVRTGSLKETLKSNQEFIKCSALITEEYDGFAFFNLDECAGNQYFQRYWFPQNNPLFKKIDNELVIYNLEKKLIKEHRYYNYKSDEKINRPLSDIFDMIPGGVFSFSVRSYESSTTLVESFFLGKEELARGYFQTTGSNSPLSIWKTELNQEKPEITAQDLETVFGTTAGFVNIILDENDRNEILSILIVERKDNKKAWDKLVKVLEKNYNKGYQLSDELLIKMEEKKSGSFRILYPDIPHHPEEFLPAIIIGKDFFVFPQDFASAEHFLKISGKNNPKSILGKELKKDEKITMVYKVDVKENMKKLEKILEAESDAYWLNYYEKQIIRKDFTELKWSFNELTHIEGVRFFTDSKTEEELVNYYFD